MSNDRYYADIRRLIEKNGPMGVNQLSKELGVPLSTMQKYMDKDQTYFKKNSARKWVLPEDSVKEDMSITSNNFSNLIESQLMSMQALIDTLMAQFRATVTLLETNKPQYTPVAEKLHPRLVKMNENLKHTENVFKQYTPVVPEEYRELIANVDLHELAVKYGSDYLNGNFNTEISALFLEKSTELSEDVIEILKEHQKE